VKKLKLAARKTLDADTAEVSGPAFFKGPDYGSVHRNTQMGFQVHSGCTIVLGERWEAIFAARIFKNLAIQAFENGEMR
jgi:hypothetical protein